MYVCIVTVDVQILIMSRTSHLQCGKEIHVYIWVTNVGIRLCGDNAIYTMSSNWSKLHITYNLRNYGWKYIQYKSWSSGNNNGTTTWAIKEVMQVHKRGRNARTVDVKNEGESSRGFSPGELQLQASHHPPHYTVHRKWYTTFDWLLIRL